MKLHLPNTDPHAFAAALIMLALVGSGAQAQGARTQPLNGDEAALGFRGSEVASLITRIVERQLLTIPGVHSVHDLHLRSVSSGIDAMSAHVVVTDMAAAARILKAVQRIMAVEFNTHHVTVQVENEVLQEEEKLRKT
jgi:divalent metal cation (Fe/Co/Zn/Cd) transporter